VTYLVVRHQQLGVGKTILLVPNIQQFPVVLKILRQEFIQT
jgi:hypothetical protein